MNPLIQFKTTVVSLVITVVLACLGLVPGAQAVSPPPDGDYPGGNTAEGFNALFHLNPQDGGFNTAVGFYSLSANVTGSFNTALGAGALDLNTGHNNTATGAAALLLNTTGNNNTAVGAGALTFNDPDPQVPNSGSGNTAVGAAALASNVTGPGNTAVGAQALFNNTGDNETPPDGRLNTAVGLRALYSNTTGNGNTAIGAGPGQTQDGYFPASLESNTTGNNNTAVGAAPAGGKGALGSNTEGVNNTAIGGHALGENTTGGFNTAVGLRALGGNTTGNSNIAVGTGAGANLTTGDANIDIGNGGVANEANTIRIGTSGRQTDTYIAGIYGRPPGANTLPVVCADDGKLTANASSRRFKHDIKQMDSASEAILALKPVSFRYNNDSTNTPWFGLIAEDVAEVNPHLTARDKEGKPFGVRYDQVNVMLLNEFLKEYRKVQQLEANAARQQKQIEALAAGLQKVSAQLELSKAAPQTVLNKE